MADDECHSSLSFLTHEDHPQQQQQQQQQVPEVTRITTLHKSTNTHSSSDDGGGNKINNGIKDSRESFSKNDKKKVKTKPRCSRAKKREMKLEREQQQQQQLGQSGKRRRLNCKGPFTAAVNKRKVQKCAIESLFTKSVVIVTLDDDQSSSNHEINGNPIIGSTSPVRVVCCCNLIESQPNPCDVNDAVSISSAGRPAMKSNIGDKDPPPPSLLPPPSVLINVQPLLVLDLNGVLCHRVRHHKQPPGSIPYLREPVGIAAQTPIIGRPGGVERLLRFLDQHFCLAVWTSAKRKSARALLNLLVPTDLQKRFLFVWTQDQCSAARGSSMNNNNDHEKKKKKDVVFEKHLRRIWDKFPLWSANNTILIDDSIDKVVHAVANSLHPIPLHGQRCVRRESPLLQTHVGDMSGSSVHNSSSCDDCEKYVPPNLSDEDNCQNQELFFQQLVKHFNDHPFSTDLDDDDNTSPLMMSNVNLQRFLSTHAQPTFVWREK